MYLGSASLLVGHDIMVFDLYELLIFCANHSGELLVFRQETRGVRSSCRVSLGENDRGQGVLEGNLME